jgi:hypothetical protein
MYVAEGMDAVSDDVQDVRYTTPGTSAAGAWTGFCSCKTCIPYIPVGYAQERRFPEWHGHFFLLQNLYSLHPCGL